MDGTTIIGIVVGVIVLAAVIYALVTASRRSVEPDEEPGRGPTGQHPDPTEGTPSETSTPHWDRTINPTEGPQ